MWSPTTCTHCARIHRQSRRMPWQSESHSEDNDTIIGAAPADNDNKQNARNNGRFLGMLT